MKRNLLIAALAMLAVAAPAAAQDAPGNITDFTGPRIEARLGYDDVKIGLEDLGVDRSVSDDGVLYGVGLGYDFPVGESVLIGIEANFTLSDVEFAGSDGADSVSIKAKRNIELAARFGTQMSDTILLYGKAGYSNARVKASATVDGFTESDAANGDGYVLGAGLEFAFSPNAYAKVEYQYTNYEADITRNQILGAVGVRF